MLSELKSSEEWAKELLPEGLAILDADGWDRGSFEASWLEPITRVEFNIRLHRSTLQYTQRALDALQKQEEEARRGPEVS